MSKRDQIVAILNRGLYQEYGVGGNKEKVEDKKYVKDTFDAGIDLETKAVTSQDAPEGGQTVKVEEDTPETEESRKERIKQQRIENMAKARSMKRKE